MESKMNIEELKANKAVRNLAWEAYTFGCRNPRDVTHPDTPKLFELWYKNIFKNWEDLEVEFDS